MVAAGIEPHLALAAATWRGGELIGIPGAGRLEVGGPAHFSLVHGDPLSDPVRAVAGLADALTAQSTSAEYTSWRSCERIG